MNIAIQLYTVRNELKNDFLGTLEKIAELGYKGVEFAGYFGENSPNELKTILDNLGLIACGNYGSLDALTEPDNEIYNYAKVLGLKYITSGLDSQKLKDDFNSCVEICKKACAVAKTKDIEICYHAHADEFLISVRETHAMTALLNSVPEMLFEADTAWIHLGNENVMSYLQAYANRIPLLHVKDVKSNDSFTELGKGILSFHDILEFAETNKIKWVIYEQDTSDDPIKSTEISFNYLKQNC
jgi:sugar phosphate isomerase/epimerase